MPRHGEHMVYRASVRLVTRSGEQEIDYLAGLDRSRVEASAKTRLILWAEANEGRMFIAVDEHGVELARLWYGQRTLAPLEEGEPLNDPLPF